MPCSPHRYNADGTCDTCGELDRNYPGAAPPRIDPKTNPNKAVVCVKLAGALARAVVEIAGELEARDDVFETMTDAEVARKLIAWAVTEHRAKRGPWATTR